MSEKPEWFQITEGDEKPEVKKSKRGFLKITAVALPLVVVGAFAVAANGGEDDAPQFSPTITTSSAASSSTNGVVTQNSNKVINASSSNSKTSPVVATVSNPSAPTPTKPSIGVQPPKGGGDESHEGFEGGEHREGGEHHHEGGEHEGSFSTRN